MDSPTESRETEARPEQTRDMRGIPRSTESVGINIDGEPLETSPLLGPSREESPEREGERRHSPPTWSGADDFKDMPWWWRPALPWLLVPFLLLALTFGATIVPLTNIIKEMLCRDIFDRRLSNDPSLPFMGLVPGQENPVCNHDKEVQSTVAIFMLWSQVLAGCLSAVTSPKLGELSDRYGRTKMLAVTTLGGLFKDIFVVLIYHNSRQISVWWLLLSYAIDGLSGSYTAAMAVSGAYASDCTSPSRRAAAFGWFQAALFAGIAIGPLISGYLVEYFGNLITLFYIAIGCHFLFLATVLLIPESLSKRRQQEARERRAKEDRLMERSRNPNQHWLRSALTRTQRYNIFRPLTILYPTGPGSSWRLRSNLMILAAVDTIQFGTAMGAVTVVILYTGYTFNWETPETNKFVSVVNVSRVVVLMVVLPLLSRLVRGRSSSTKHRESGCDTLDLVLIRLSLIFDTLGYIGYALAPTGHWMVVAGIICSIGGIGSPTLQASLTKHVSSTQVGQLLGATGLLHALARVVAPAVFNYIYARTVLIDMPATVFVVLASCFGVAFVCSIFLRRGVYYDSKAVEEAERELEREEEEQRQGRNEEEAVVS